MAKKTLGKVPPSPIAFEIARIPQMTPQECQDRLVELITIATMRYLEEMEKSESSPDVQQKWEISNEC